MNTARKSCKSSQKTSQESKKEKRTARLLTPANLKIKQEPLSDEESVVYPSGQAIVTNKARKTFQSSQKMQRFVEVKKEKRTDRVQIPANLKIKQEPLSDEESVVYPSGQATAIKNTARKSIRASRKISLENRTSRLPVPVNLKIKEEPISDDESVVYPSVQLSSITIKQEPISDDESAV